jgi:hypothetical protein
MEGWDAAVSGLGLEQSFSNDALNYFVERLDPATSRSALIEVVRHAKRGKAFQDCRFIGLALDGTEAGRSQPIVPAVVPCTMPGTTRSHTITNWSPSVWSVPV